MSNETVKYVDLFAGIGGFAATMVGMGFESLLAVEKDTAAAAVYKDNWGDEALGNIVDPNRPDFGNTIEIGPHDILTGGFPCQPFSKSGNQEGVLDASRGTLFGNIVAVLKNLPYESRPTLVILENVRNLAGPKHKDDLKQMKDSLRLLGYTVEEGDIFLSPHQLKREFGGSPQNRERIFLVGVKHPNGNEKNSTSIVTDYLNSMDLNLSAILETKKAPNKLMIDDATNDDNSTVCMS
jgi:DNA (cytosine-5)-methyltransferase 1